MLYFIFNNIDDFIIYFFDFFVIIFVVKDFKLNFVIFEFSN